MNIYNVFRGVTQVNKSNIETLNKRFDEPTYFSFKLQFANDNDNAYNRAENGALYDTMPHPLFSKYAPVGSGYYFNEREINQKKKFYDQVQCL